MTRLHCITYLAPSIPTEWFEFVTAQLGRVLGIPATLECDVRTSGPRRGGDDPFSHDRADLGFVCAPTYLWLTEKKPAPVRLLEAAPVFEDPRLQGKPALLSDVVVRSQHPATSCADLVEDTWAYNDPCSQTGWFSILERMVKLGAEERFVAKARRVGSHLEALTHIQNGDVAAAAIDSNALASLRRQDPAAVEGLRIVESLGPYPVQPVVVRSGFPADLRQQITRTLLDLHRDAATRNALADFGVRRFARVRPGLYEGQRPALRACESRLARCKRGEEAA